MPISASKKHQPSARCTPNNPNPPNPRPSAHLSGQKACCRTSGAQPPPQRALRHFWPQAPCNAIRSSFAQTITGLMPNGRGLNGVSATPLRSGRAKGYFSKPNTALQALKCSRSAQRALASVKGGMYRKLCAGIGDLHDAEALPSPSLRDFIGLLGRTRVDPQAGHANHTVVSSVVEEELSVVRVWVRRRHGKTFPLRVHRKLIRSSFKAGCHGGAVHLHESVPLAVVESQGTGFVHPSLMLWRWNFPCLKRVSWHSVGASVMAHVPTVTRCNRNGMCAA